MEEHAANAVAHPAGNEPTINVGQSEDGSWLLVFSMNIYVGGQAVAEWQL